MSILIVEDYTNLGQFFRLVLDKRGFETRRVCSTEEALIAVRAERPELILADLALPGQSGLALVRYLQAEPELASIPVIATTADDITWPRKEMLAAGCVDYLVKPVYGPDLVNAVSRHLPEPDLK